LTCCSLCLINSHRPEKSGFLPVCTANTQNIREKREPRRFARKEKKRGKTGSRSETLDRAEDPQPTNTDLVEQVDPVRE
jgi:hypothetical protein